MPAPVIERAREVLKTLEETSRDGAAARRKASPAPQLSLLDVPTGAPSEVEAALAAIDPDALTPLQALTKLYELRAKLRKD
jgi:DNA mismatch repair protein MutS